MTDLFTSAGVDALRQAIAPVTDDDLMVLEAVIIGVGGGCTCEECKAVREALDRIGDAVEAVQALVEGP